jgi:ABC-2 type transport system permease protein
MTRAAAKLSSLTAVGPHRSARHAFPFSALWTVFTLTLRQHTRGRRLLVLTVLFLLPTLIAVLVRAAVVPAPPAKALEFALIFNLIPHALVPLTALLYASGMIQDEIEEQTLTYLLVRPLPRWALYVTKLLATFFLTIALSGFWTIVAFGAIYWGTPQFWSTIPQEALKTVGIQALTLVAYCSLFGCMSLYTRWSLVVGVGYIALFEGLLANIPFVVRQFTVMFYFRVLSVRWLKLDPDQWSLEMDTAPDSGHCAMYLLVAGLLATLLAATAFTRNEFRLKTPEGS